MAATAQHCRAGPDESHPVIPQCPDGSWPVACKTPPESAPDGLHGHHTTTSASSSTHPTSGVNGAKRVATLERSILFRVGWTGADDADDDAALRMNRGLCYWIAYANPTPVPDDWCAQRAFWPPAAAALKLHPLPVPLSSLLRPPLPQSPPTRVEVAAFFRTTYYGPDVLCSVSFEPLQIHTPFPWMIAGAE